MEITVTLFTYETDPVSKMLFSLLFVLNTRRWTSPKTQHAVLQFRDKFKASIHFTSLYLVWRTSEKVIKINFKIRKHYIKHMN
jgi:hypothetical protein